MSDATTRPLKPFRAQYMFTLEAHDLGCAGKQQRDLLEAAADLGFVLQDRALGELLPAPQNFGPRGEVDGTLGGTRLAESSQEPPSSGTGEGSREAGSDPCPVTSDEKTSREFIAETLCRAGFQPNRAIHQMVLAAFDTGTAVRSAAEGSVV